jgi:hypothetical protein
VRQATATSNFGTVTTNDIASAAAANRRLYLRFDLTQCSPAIPASAVVRLATLRNYATVLAAALPDRRHLPVTATWTEAAITWNNQPFGTAINNPASGSATDILQHRHARRLREPDREQLHHRRRRHVGRRGVRRRNGHELRLDAPG